MHPHVEAILHKLSPTDRRLAIARAYITQGPAKFDTIMMANDRLRVGSGPTFMFCLDTGNRTSRPHQVKILLSGTNDMVLDPSGLVIQVVFMESASIFTYHYNLKAPRNGVLVDVNCLHLSEELQRRALPRVARGTPVTTGQPNDGDPTHDGWNRDGLL